MFNMNGATAQVVVFFAIGGEEGVTATPNVLLSGRLCAQPTPGSTPYASALLSAFASSSQKRISVS